MLEVDILNLDELKNVRVLIGQLTAIVTMKDSTGIITLEIVNNLISTFEEISAEREELDALMFEEEE